MITMMLFRRGYTEILNHKILCRNLMSKFARKPVHSQLISYKSSYASEDIYQNSFLKSGVKASSNFSVNWSHTDAKISSKLSFENDESLYNDLNAKISFYHNILRNSTKCSLNEITDSNKDVLVLNSLDLKQFLEKIEESYIDTNKLIENFMNLGSHATEHYVDISEPVIDQLIIYLTEIISQLSDQQLLDILSQLPNFKDSNSSDSLKSFMFAFDNQICQRRRNFPLAAQFKIFDNLYLLGYAPKSLFCYKAYSDIGRYIKVITPKQLVQYCFFGSVIAHSRFFEFIPKLFTYFCNVMDDISIEEIAIIVMGLRSCTRVISAYPFLVSLTDALEKNISKISNVSMYIILEYLLDIKHTKQKEHIEKILNVFIPNISNFDHHCISKMFIISSMYSLLEIKYINDVIETLFPKIENLSLKSLYGILLIYQQHENIQKEGFYILDQICKALEGPSRIQEINDKPRLFVNTVKSLLRLNGCSQTLLSACLQPSMIKLIEYKDPLYDIKNALIEIDTAIEIEFGNKYSGYRLEPPLRQSLLKNILKKIPIDQNRSYIKKTKDEEVTITEKPRLLQRTHKYVNSFLGNEYSKHTFILPQYHSSDIVFITDENGKPQEIPSDFLEVDINTIKYPLGNYQCNILILPLQMYSKQEIIMKGRLLEKLGYNVCIPNFSYTYQKDEEIEEKMIYECLKKSSSVV